MLMDSVTFAELELSSGSNSLCIFFGGIAGGLSIPPFEFYKSAKILDDHKLFVRDLRQTWYQRTPELSDPSVNGMAEYLRNVINSVEPEDVRFIGNSMGGYAAILYCCLLGRGEAVAFSPQTFVSPKLKLAHRDFRWPRQTTQTWLASVTRGKFWDLLPLVSETSNAIRIVCSRDHKLDMRHAMRLSVCPTVSITLLEEGGHSVVKELRDQGGLESMLKGSSNL